MLQGLDQRDKERYPLKYAINHTGSEPLIDRISDPVAQLKTHAWPRFRDQLNKSVLFIYTGGRSARLQGLQKSESPREFFYGYPFFKEKGLKVDFVETDNVSRHRISIRHWRLRRNSKKLTKHFGIGCRAHMLLDLIDKINQYDVVIGTTDSIGLGLCYLKRSGAIDVDIIFLNMGLGSGIAMRDHDKTVAHRRIEKEVIALLGYCKNLVSLGKPEYQYFLSVAPELEENLTFLPFGIDTQFWRPLEGSRVGEAKTVLSVGNDLNRDWDMALKVASICPEVHFKFLTRRLKRWQCPPNVELIAGDIKGMSISDVAVRTLYQESDLVMIPLRQTLQPSGQSVALQSLACGTAVLISKTKGLWDSSRFIDGDTIDLVKLGSPEFFKTKIDLSFSCSARSLEIARRGRALVSQEYSVEIFAEHLQEICSH